MSRPDCHEADDRPPGGTRDATERTGRRPDPDGVPSPVTDGGGSGRRAGGPDAALGTASRDRQVLVVGGGIAGMALTALLDRSGYDPVAVTSPGRTPPSMTALLPPAALDVLGAAGIDVDPLEAGERVERVEVYRSGNATEVVRADPESAPAVVRTDRLHESLREVVADATVERRVAAVERERNALEVTFDDDVREWFDVVAVTCRQAQADGPPAVGCSDVATLDQYEAVVDAEAAGAGLLECRNGRGLVQLGPVPRREGALLRVTTVAGGATDTTKITEAGTGTGTTTTSDDSPVDGFRRAVAAAENGPLPSLSSAETADVAHRTVPQTVGGGDWGDGRIATCGASALPVAPATGVRTALALADAWELSDELLRGSQSVPDAVRSYAGRRERWTDTLLREGDATAGWSDADGPGTVEALAAYRGAALAWFRGSTPGAVGPGESG